MKAQGKTPTKADVDSARGIRTKKDRGSTLVGGRRF